MTINISTQKVSKNKRFYVETQIGKKSQRGEREHCLVCRGYSEFVELSSVYNLYGSIGLD